jgi:hypothetical protein
VLSQIEERTDQRLALAEDIERKMDELVALLERGIRIGTEQAALAASIDLRDRSFNAARTLGRYLAWRMGALVPLSFERPHHAFRQKLADIERTFLRPAIRPLPEQVEAVA